MIGNNKFSSPRILMFVSLFECNFPAKKEIVNLKYHLENAKQIKPLLKRNPE